MEIAKWLKGIPYEVAFWNNVYRWKHTRDGTLRWSNYGKEICLDGFDAPTYLKQFSNPVVLDVGCGMTYAPGNHLKAGEELLPLDVRYVDPLAPFFNKIKNRYRADLPEISFGMMEFLSSFYPVDSVSLVIIQNALDHSSDPVKGIIESLAVLRNGGVLYLNHHPNEAEVEHYKGFHQYNITNDGGRLVIWNRESRCDVADVLAGIATVEVSETEDGHVVAVLKKTAAVPPAMLADKEDKRQLCEAMINRCTATFGVAGGMRSGLTYYKYNIIQFFVQALPWETKMWLKKKLKR